MSYTFFTTEFDSCCPLKKVKCNEYFPKRHVRASAAMLAFGLRVGLNGGLLAADVHKQRNDRIRIKIIKINAKTKSLSIPFIRRY